jgi:hypothetical protein
MSTDHRAAAQASLARLIALLNATPIVETPSLVRECESLSTAIAAFHMEGIRFRIFNVDRMIGRLGAKLPSSVPPLVDQVRKDLEAAGFHTRSHQAPI